MAEQIARSAQSVYPIPPGDYQDVGYRYENAQPGTTHPIPPPPQQQPIYTDLSNDDTAELGPVSASKPKGEVKPRLRKACDSCSVRKVKCDESGPPCKSCAALEIPCTFNRPSRRRGPPNRHAEAIKRQRLDDGSYNLVTTSQMVASPTRDAAYGLAALSAPVPNQLSAEMICDLETLKILIDDYFTFIHPLIPIPHEPTFREQFRRREDVRDRSFLALLAGMVETLVASFPRRVKQIFSSPEARQAFPHASVLVERCQFVFSEARGKGFLDREELNLYDACGSYMAAISAAYIFDLRRWRLYCGECIMITRTLNFQKPENFPIHEGMSLIDLEIGRRLFWLCFVGAMTVRQIGSSDSDVIIPNAHSDGMPPMPIELDDQYITSTQYLNQPPGELSIIAGFNLNIRVYRAFHAMTAIEMAVGSDVLFDWDKQRSGIRTALRNVKGITHDAPMELRLEKRQEFGEWPPRQSDMSSFPYFFDVHRDPVSGSIGIQGMPDAGQQTQYSRKTVAYEIQKANIYSSQLGTRSYLVERYWNLYEILEKQRMSQSPTQHHDTKSHSHHHSHSSPTVAFLASGFENRFLPPTSHRTPSESHGVDEGEQQMAIEREDIVRDMARLLNSVNQVNMEPNGHSVCHKIRQVASTLLSQDRSLMSRMPTLDADEVQDYLRRFIDILAKLERIGTSLLHGTNYDHQPPQNGQQMQQGQGQGLQGTYFGGKTQEEIEEEELVQWASLKEHQERFVTKHGSYLAL